MKKTVYSFWSLRPSMSFQNLLMILKILILLLVGGLLSPAYSLPTKDSESSSGELTELIADYQQQVSVSGTITDASTGEPMPGVNIQAKGTTIGTITDAGGKYSLSVTDRNATIVFSFIGYISQEIPLAGRSTLNVTLVSETVGLEEVVVVGYGTQKKVNLTGAVDVIDQTNIVNRQLPTVSQLLQGSSPGLNFSVDNNGFQPGADLDIKIRGIGSLTGGSPYVLIDGVAGNMDALNPEDIESISVLKDAAASAIYGARAPFGVILITTKSGKPSKISVTYNGNVSISYVQKMPVMVNSVTNARVNNEANRNAGSAITYTDAAIDRMYAYIAGDWDYLKQFTLPDATHFETIPLESGVWAEYNHGHSNHDWFKEFYGGGKLNTKHNLSLQGGGESVSYYFSTGYLTQQGDVNYATDTFNRINLLGKINAKITDWWDFNYQVRFMKSERENPNMGWEGEYSLMFHQVARAKPMIPMYDGYGNYLEKCMILETKYSGTDQTQNIENWNVISTELRPIKNWKINVDFSYQNFNQFRRDVDKNAFLYDVNKNPYVLGITDPNQIQQYYKNNYYWTSNIYSSYNFDLSNQHAFSLMLGTQLEYAKDRGMDATKTGLLVQDEVPSLQTAIGTPNVSEYISHWATLGYFSRFTYNYKEKYLFESNLRIDGSSRFKFGNRWGIFPSVSAGWNIHKEPFWNSIEDYINTFKLKVSWGSLGNQNVAAYQDLVLVPLITQPLDWIWGFGQLRPIGYTGQLPLVSPNLTWETATTKNIGTNLSFLKNRLNVAYDLFERNTLNMIGPAKAKPGVLGVSVPQENNSSLRTRGFELSIGWKDMINDKFSYFVNMNLYDSKTIITKYENPTGILTTWYEGKEEGEIWGYTANDLYRTLEDLEYTNEVNLSFIFAGKWKTGDLKYEDINGDKKVNNGKNTLSDHGDLSIIGNATPHYEFGISSGITFKNFDFSMIWKGVLKRSLFFSSSQNMFWGIPTSIYDFHLDYYRDQPGTKYYGLYEGDANINLNSYWPRPYAGGSGANRNKQPSTRYLVNGAFARLQNVQLGFNFGGTVLSKLHLQNMRAYVSGENLITLKKIPDGIDPIATQSSWGTGKTYGANRIISFGFQMTY